MPPDDGAIFEAVVFLECFADLPDPRQAVKVIYPLAEVLLLTLCAIVAGAETFTDIALFGEQKLGLLRRFLPFAHGTAPHDRLGTIFAALDPEAFAARFATWVATLTGVPEGVVAIDGKTCRRTFKKKGESLPIHIVSAFAAKQRLVLAQTKVAEKSNEIVAIPKLLDMLDIAGAIVTIDAMGCQRAIAQKIIDKKADYILALKGNQGTLRDDVELFFNEQKDNDFKDTSITTDVTVDADHGRVETRKTTVIHDVAWLRERHDWPGLRALVMVESQRQAGPKIERETRFYITSLSDPANLVAAAIRAHWGVENGLHWVMDMVFRDDESRVRTDHAPTNFAIAKHIAFNLIRQRPRKFSMRATRKVAAWNDDVLADILTK
jgi:predicted transposase YbfD/YdcC